jgi:DNA-binding transcriptional LysR family regulator
MQRKHGKSPLLPRTLRVGVSRTIGLAYLPGFFRAFQRKLPDAQLQVSHQPSNFILAAVESGELDAGIVSLPPRVPSAVELARQFNDEFVLILPPHSTVKFPQPLAAAKLTEVLKRQRWLLITRQSNTGKRLHAWLQDCGLRREPAIEADNFDFIVNLVSLGLGASLVPHRVLALHPGTRPVTRIRTEPRFSRQLAVIARRQADQPELVSTFVENLLF